MRTDPGRDPAEGEMAQVAESTEAVERNIGLLRSRDSLHAYMYLPALDGHFDESVACLFRPSLVSDGFLSGPPRRVQQMRDEGSVRSETVPASVYDVDPETAT